MRWLLNLAYALFLLALSPVLLYRVIVLGKYRAGWAEKLLGRLPRLRRPEAGNHEDRGSGSGDRDPRPSILDPQPAHHSPLTTHHSPVWFHAVSVGEVLQLETVIAELTRRRPDLEIVVTTTTSTGRDVARRKFPRHTVCYFPLDFSWAVKNAIRRVQPAAIVLVELELWPNFIFEARRQGVPLALINGRVSDRSYRGYRWIRPLMRRLLGCFDVLAVQNQIYARRLIDLGAEPAQVTVTGSVKFDGVETDRGNPQTRELRGFFGIGGHERVFLAGSTQAPEENYALDAWLALREEHPELRLILVPRHRERFDEVARMVESRGLPLLRRSRQAEIGSQRSGVRGERSEARGQRSDFQLSTLNSQLGDHSPVLLLDTLGELAACWGLADIAFVGGSLENGRGGQNMIEPAAYGAAVLFGPDTRNFRDVTDMLLEHNAARVVGSRDELTAALRDLLQRPEAAGRMGAAAQSLVLRQQGATTRTIDALQAVLPNNLNKREAA